MYCMLLLQKLFWTLLEEENRKKVVNPYNFWRFRMAADHQWSFSSVLNSNFLGWFLANTSATSVSELLPFYFFPGLELNFGTQFPMNFVNSPKELLKNIFMTYCSRLWKQRMIMLKCPLYHKKSQILQPRLYALIIDRFFHFSTFVLQQPSHTLPLPPFLPSGL